MASPDLTGPGDLPPCAPRRISENLIDHLDHEVIRLSSQDVPTAYAKLLEDATIVSSKDVVRAIHRICGAPARA